MSREVERVIRNMADLRRRRRKDGTKPLDPARELAQRVIVEEQGRGQERSGAGVAAGIRGSDSDAPW